MRVIGEPGDYFIVASTLKVSIVYALQAGRARAVFNERKKVYEPWIVLGLNWLKNLEFSRLDAR